MTYEITKNYGAEGITKILNEYGQSWIEREIKNVKDDLTIMQQFLSIAEKRLVVVRDTKFIAEVSIDKEKNYSSGHINYRVNVYRYPDIPDGNKHKVFDFYNEGKIFPKGDGPTKKEAFQYARMLAINHSCKIVGNVSDQVNAKKEIIEV
jgi:hypothetical protein